CSPGYARPGHGRLSGQSRRGTPAGQRVAHAAQVQSALGEAADQRTHSQEDGHQQEAAEAEGQGSPAEHGGNGQSKEGRVHGCSTVSEVGPPRGAAGGGRGVRSGGCGTRWLAGAGGAPSAASGIWMSPISTLTSMTCNPVIRSTAT